MGGLAITDLLAVANILLLPFAERTLIELVEPFGVPILVPVCVPFGKALQAIFERVRSPLGHVSSYTRARAIAAFEVVSALLPLAVIALAPPSLATWAPYAALAIASQMILLLSLAWWSEPRDRAVGALGYFFSNMLWFALFYWSGFAAEWLSFTLDHGGEFGFAEALYLAVGGAATSGAAGIAPSNSPARLCLVVQLAMLLVFIYWLLHFSVEIRSQAQSALSREPRQQIPGGDRDDRDVG